MQEASWVRSVYLYAMCVVSMALIGLGSIAAVTGVVHAIAPDLGHRDTLDRVGIGLSNVASNVVTLLDGTQNGGEAYCRDVTTNSDDFDSCVNEQLGGTEEMSAIQDGISEVRSELKSQIRTSSIDLLIRGLMLIGAGLLLFRIHGHRTTLFADGLMPKKPEPPAAPAAVIPPPPQP